MYTIFYLYSIGEKAIEVLLVSENQYPLRTVRSFMRRAGRMSQAKKTALNTLWDDYCLELTQDTIDLDAIFQRHAPRILEIGFGMGYSLLEQAQNNPQQDFIGIEVHRPGVAVVLGAMATNNLHNIRLFCADAVVVLQQCIADASLDAVQIFFPDPWQKRRHHKRRLIQPVFLELLVSKLKTGGKLYLATDWEDYANHMLQTLTTCKSLENAYTEFAPRCPHRALTKFEVRGQKLGHSVWDLLFVKK